MNIEYFLVLAAMVAIPFAASFHPALKIYRYWKALIGAIVTPIIVFGVWDVIATKLGHWHFNPQYVIGMSFLGLPVEEWLFFVALPFVSIFTWEALNHLLRRNVAER